MKPKKCRWWRSNPINLKQTLQHLKNKLVENGTDTPSNISLILAGHALNRSKSWMLSHGEYELNPDESQALQSSLDQFLQSVPLPYILGHWDFFGRTFAVTPAVLIPRPETELLVEKAIEIAGKKKYPRIVDVGTGSGAIAISLAASCPSAIIIALDLSFKALQVAQHNASVLKQTQVNFIQSDLLTPFETKFDLICANLPYIPTATLNRLSVAKWEPRLALDGGASGLDPIHSLLQQAQSRLTPGGVILIEMEASLGKATLAVAQEIFPSAHHRLYQDMAGHDRLLEIHQA